MNLKEGTKDYFEVAPGVWGMNILFVNIYMIAEGDQWVLIDAGLTGFANKIKKMATELFGENKPPAAIILTHGHFDHRGALKSLLKTWDVDVYCHQMELPYLTGQSAYPPPDPFVGGGLMSLLSAFYPKSAIDLGDKIHALPDTGALPFLPDWVYFHTPGHSPGHISLFRSRDKVLIAGDAFVTTKQESAIYTITNKKYLSGPPKYFTPDWIAAKESVKHLRDLHPSIAATGHGKAMQGKELSEGLDYLIAHFEETAEPKTGRYIEEPAKANKNGVQYIPPATVKPLLYVTVGTVAGLLVFTLVRFARR